MKQKRCTKCDRRKPITAFYSRGDGFGVRSECVTCSDTRYTNRKRRLIEDQRCPRCGTKKKKATLKHCARCLTIARTQGNQRYRDPANQELFRRQRHERQRRLKDAAYAAYGGYRCACCATTHPEFLSVDHIEGNGAAHRKTFKGGGRGVALYAWLKRNDYPPGFRILCMNCNFALGHAGYCPHAKLPRKAPDGTQT